jgi:hypothetical protein
MWSGLTAATVAPTSLSSAAQDRTALSNLRFVTKARRMRCFESVGFSFRDLEVANNLFRRAFPPALQDLRSEIRDVSEVPIKTTTRHLQLHRYRANFQSVGPVVRERA